MAYVESPKQDATAGELAGLEHEARADEVEAKQVVAQAEAAVASKEGEISESNRKQASAEQDARYSADDTLVTDIISQKYAPGLEMLETGLDLLSDRRVNPSQGADVAKAGIVGESFEDSFKATKSPIKTAFGRSIAEKAKGVTGSMKGLTEDTKGVQDSGVAAAKVQVATIKGMVFQHGIANEKVLGQVIAAKRAAPAPGMGGPGGARGPQLEHNAMENGPKYITTDEEAWV